MAGLLKIDNNTAEVVRMRVNPDYQIVLKGSVNPG